MISEGVEYSRAKLEFRQVYKQKNISKSREVSSTSAVSEGLKMKDLGGRLEDNERRAFRDKHCEVVGIIGVLAGLGYTFFAKDEKGFNLVNLFGNMGAGAIYGISGGYILGSLGLMAKSIGEKISEKYYEKYFGKEKRS